MAKIVSIMSYHQWPVDEQIAWLARWAWLARELAAEAETERAGDLAEEKAPYQALPPGMRALQRYVADFLALVYAGLTTGTIEGYRTTLRRFGEFCAVQEIDPLRLTGPQARDFRNLLVGRGLAPSTINGALSNLKKFYEYLMEEGFQIGRAHV